MGKQSLEQYYQAVDLHGLSSTWQAICFAVLSARRPDLVLVGDVLQPSCNASFAAGWSLDDFPDFYEAGLAHADKGSKRALGQYYTPVDTARHMARKLVDAMCDGCGRILVEPCVGCGNLLMEMLRLLPDPWGVATGRMVVFDLDRTAMLVTITRVIIEFAPQGAAVDYAGFDMRVGDFLLSGFRVTDGHVVISNPPYGRVDNPAYASYRTYPTRDFYPLFLERLMGAYRMAIIVPQSFLGSRKFESLRLVMAAEAGGTVVAYDNVPASIFNKRKHGVFNTNTSNSVRAAIVVSEAEKAGDGWHVSPMLRWVADERPMLFDASDRLVRGTRVSVDGNSWPKVPATLTNLYEGLVAMPRLSGLCDPTGVFELHIPSTPRYFVTAAVMPLARSVFHVLRFPDIQTRNLAYLILNSSVSYCWWRWHDGGISISQSTLMDIPVPVSASAELNRLAEKFIADEPKRIIVKRNAGKPNQNLKLGEWELREITRFVLPGRSLGEYEALAASHANNLTVSLSAWETTLGA